MVLIAQKKKEVLLHAFEQKKNSCMLVPLMLVGCTGKQMGCSSIEGWNTGASRYLGQEACAK